CPTRAGLAPRWDGSRIGSCQNAPDPRCRKRPGSGSCRHRRRRLGGCPRRRCKSPDRWLGTSRTSAGACRGYQNESRLILVGFLI
ncbi:hypothetical protein ABTM44_18345, partial [Acinetobacter baumannii]